MSSHPRTRIVPLFIPHMGCPYRCSFCDQKSISGEEAIVTPETIRKELEEAFSDIGSQPAEIAFYGGSFTALNNSLMEAFLREAEPYIKTGRASSVRCSTRPDCITPEIIQILKKYKVDTVELGAQSLNDEVLKKNFRGHSSQDVRSAFALLRENGFTVGLQMMTGLPGDTRKTLFETVDEIVRLHPDMLRVYPTVVLKGTLLDRWRQEGSFIPMGLEEAVDVCTDILERMEKENIPIIRMGLHASASVERDMTGGAYHPAFREMCQSELIFRRITPSLRKYPEGSRFIIRVPKKEISAAVGCRRKNILRWKEMGYSAVVKEGTSESKEVIIECETDCR